MNKFITSPYLHAFLAGAVAVFGFAPFGLFPLPVLALAVLFRLWSRAERPAQAAWIGLSFGMGLFCVGISWIYVALHIYGYMHPILAAIATALFAAVNATLPALAGYVQARIKPFVVSPSTGLRTGLSNHERPTLGWFSANAIVILLVMPAIWTLAEWLRGLLFTGFPWLSIGYSQVPNSPLAGYAPMLGVYGVSLMVAVSAALSLSLICGAAPTPSPSGGGLGWGKNLRTRATYMPMLLLFCMWIAGAALQSIEWTHPQGEPLKVALLQGNIAQDEKFEEGKLVSTLETYRRLAQNSDARLIVMPETALPLLRQNVPEGYQLILGDHVRRNGGDILIGAFEKENGNYYNSVYSLGSAESQHYRKNHLVPFGEFIPLRSVFGWFVNEVLQIPMGDQTSGGAHQPPLAVAGQKVAVNICYEDAFGEEIIRALPQATLLVNVTNDAWYGDSFAAIQHNQLSQMRALETGRMMLRATNTGVTSIIGTDGRIRDMLPQHQEGVLNGMAQGYVGSTMYVVWGNAGVLVLAGLMLGAAWGMGRRK